MMKMNNLTQDFWKRFSDTRHDTLAVVSEKTGIPLATIKGWNSKGRLPKLTEAIKLAEYLGVSLDWLILGKVVEREGDNISSVINAYIKADDKTKYVINRILEID